MGAVGAAWEFAAVLAFFERFWGELGLPDGGGVFSADALEAALEAAGPPGAVLRETHEALLRGLHPRLREGAWLPLLAEKVRQHWWEPPSPPFAPERGQEESCYSALLPLQKLAVLRLLCDLYLSEGKDARRRLDAALKNSAHPRKALKSGRRAEDLEWLSDFRGEPLGSDAEGRVYWWVCLPRTLGFRLFVEDPPRGRGGAEALPLPGWGVAARDSEGLKALAGRLLRSPSRSGQKLGRELQEEVLPDLERRTLREERRVKRLLRAARFGMDAGLILGGGGGERRSRRQVARVNYAEQLEDFDAQLRDNERAERGAHRRRLEGERFSRAQAKASALAADQTQRQEQALRLGHRRGRSAAAAAGAGPLSRIPGRQSGSESSERSLERSGVSASSEPDFNEEPGSVSTPGGPEENRRVVRATAGHHIFPATAQYVGDGRVVPRPKQDPLLTWMQPGSSQDQPGRTKCVYKSEPGGFRPAGRHCGTASGSITEGGSSGRESPLDSSKSFEPTAAREGAEEISEPSSFGGAGRRSGFLRRTEPCKRPKYSPRDSSCEPGDSIENVT